MAETKKKYSTYTVLIDRSGSRFPDAVLYYGQDREEAIKTMGKYVKKNGFTFDGWAITGVKLVEKDLDTREIIRSQPYLDFYDVFDNRRKKEGDED